ncbi:hypothetical protein SAMD00024442_52_2 [Candidatus Symbiothrix dinenymphae]|nr:hypothetical protein SAMD00024442_52_2 [Candidatus Symbiothrix dinenymphae]
MITNADIMRFAANNKQFTRKELINYLEKYQQLVSSNAVSMQLKRLLNKHALVRPKLGVYALPEQSKADFFITNTNDIKQISEQIKAQFPFIHYCVWSSKVVLPYMHHVPNLNFLLVDVERDASEAVFNMLHAAETPNRIFLMPTQTDFDRYVVGNEAIIVRTLVSEAPLQVYEKIPTPALEKILVDMVGDIEFSFLQGAEIHYVYTAIFERHKVNTNKLLRYATRHGRKQEVQQLLNENKL